MPFRTFNLALVPVAAIGMAACSSSNPNQQMDNGFIAYVDDVTGEITNAGSAGFKYTLEDDELELSWNKGPLKNTKRTFNYAGAEGSVFEYDLDSMEEEGYILAVSNGEGLFALGFVTPDGETKTATGVAHFGNKPTDVPTSGTVNYTGVVVGDYIHFDTFDIYAGTASIGVNFADGGVTGTLYDLQSVSTDTGYLPIGFSGTLDGGGTTYTATDVTWGGSEVTGKVLGGLYGPGATTTAGAFDVTYTGGNTRTLGGYLAQSAP